MSNQSSNSMFKSSFTYSSKSSSNNNGEVSGQRSTHSTTKDGSGMTVHSSTQNLGEPVKQETRRYDSRGRQQLGEGGAGSRQVQEASDEEQAKRDAEYEERMEEEYAKREGGA